MMRLRLLLLLLILPGLARAQCYCSGGNFSSSTLATPTITGNTVFPGTTSGNVFVTQPVGAVGTGIISWPVGTTTGVVVIEAGHVDLTAQTANKATSDVTANLNIPGMYLVCANTTVTTAGTTSTLPQVQINWTDAESSGAIAAVTMTTCIPTCATNTTSTTSQGCITVNAKSGTKIQYATTGYASSGTTMQYSAHVRATLIQ